MNFYLNMTKPLLSICIPTYNRAHYLKECLECITCQFVDKEVLDQVEVVVSDNASPDNTKKLVEGFQRKHNNIQYFRNDSNLGFDRNVDSALTKATGDFRWTLGDDDFLKQNSIRFVIDIIKKNTDVGAFCIDINNKLKKKIILFKNGNEFMKNPMFTGGTLCQTIFNKKFLPKDRNKYYDNLWIFFSIFLEIIAKKPIIFMKNVFKKQEPRCLWAENGRLLKVNSKLIKIIKDLKKYGYDAEIINNYTYNLYRELPKTVASAKIHGLKTNFKNFMFILNEFSDYPFWIFLSMLTFFTPSVVFKLIKMIKYGK